MNRTEGNVPRYPCHIHDIEDAGEAHDALMLNRVRDLGDSVCLEDGTFLHRNYEWDDGGRSLVRCEKCGGLLIWQSSVDHSFSDSPDGSCSDWIPAASTEEAKLLNILLNPGEMANLSCRHLRETNEEYMWLGDQEPESRDPEELIRAIREKYPDADPELLDRLIRDALEETEDEDSIPDQVSLNSAREEVRCEVSEGKKTRALIFDRTGDEDIREIQKMAAVLDTFLRTEKTGFGNIHMHIVNDPGSDDVSWERTEDGYALHLCAESGKHWCQVAYQLGYLMMHCLMDHLSDGGEGISWAEELICETAALEVFDFLSENWEETPFGQEDPDYTQYLREYVELNLSDQGTSALLRCMDRDELKEINERNLFDDRLDESHDLYRMMKSGDLLTLAGIRKYEMDDLLLDTHAWRSFSGGSGAVDYICRLQERIPGCDHGNHP